MPRLSSLLKSPIVSLPPSRAVPNGGLGGIVQVTDNENTGNDENEQAEEEVRRTTGAQRSKKKPSPIQVNHVDTIQQPVRTAPAMTAYQENTRQTMWKAMHPTMKSANALASIPPEYDPMPGSDVPVRSLDQRFIDPWSDSRRRQSEKPPPPPPFKDTPWSQSKPPAELPGSAPTSTHGMRPKTYTASSPTESERMRANSDSSVSSMSQYSTTSAISTYSAVSECTVPARVMMQKTSPVDVLEERLEAPLPPFSRPQVVTPNTEISIAKSINTLTAVDLTRIMTKMPNGKLVTDWLPAMMKEMDKYKSLLTSYRHGSEKNIRSIRALVDELQTLVAQMKNEAQKAGEFFEQAQAEVDHGRRTDLQKLHDTEEYLHHTLLTCTQQSRKNPIQVTEFNRLRHTLHEVLRIVGDCTRNNLAHRLFECKSLTPEVIKRLQEFKQSDELHLQTSTDLDPDSAREDLYEQIRDMSSNLDDCQDLIREQQRTISGVDAAREDLIRRQMEQSQEISKMRTQVAQQEELIRDLHRENNELNRRITIHSGASTSSAANNAARRPNTSSMIGVSRGLSPDIQSLLEDRESRLLRQNAMIDDLLRQINELHKSPASRTGSTSSQSSITPPPLYSPGSALLLSPARSLPSQQTREDVESADKARKKKERKSRLTIRSFLPGMKGGSTNGSKSKINLLSPSTHDLLSPEHTPRASDVGMSAMMTQGISATTILSPQPRRGSDQHQHQAQLEQYEQYEQDVLTPTPTSYFAHMQHEREDRQSHHGERGYSHGSEYERDEQARQQQQQQQQQHHHHHQHEQHEQQDRRWQQPRQRQAIASSPPVSPSTLPLPLTPIPSLALSPSALVKYDDCNDKSAKNISGTDVHVRQVRQVEYQQSGQHRRRPAMTAFPTTTSRMNNKHKDESDDEDEGERYTHESEDLPVTTRFQDYGYNFNHTAFVTVDKSAFDDDDNSDAASFETMMCNDTDTDTDTDSDSDRYSFDHEDDDRSRYSHTWDHAAADGDDQHHDRNNVLVNTGYGARPYGSVGSIQTNDSGKWEWTGNHHHHHNNTNTNTNNGTVGSANSGKWIWNPDANESWGNWQWQDDDIGHGLRDTDLEGYDARLKVRLMSV